MEEDVNLQTETEQSEEHMGIMWTSFYDWTEFMTSKVGMFNQSSGPISHIRSLCPSHIIDFSLFHMCSIIIWPQKSFFHELSGTFLCVAEREKNVDDGRRRLVSAAHKKSVMKIDENLPSSTWKFISELLSIVILPVCVCLRAYPIVSQPWTQPRMAKKSFSRRRSFQQ